MPRFGLSYFGIFPNSVEKHFNRKHNLFSYSVQSYTFFSLYFSILLLFIIANELVYNLIYQVLICKWCQTYIIPGAANIEWHLQTELYRLFGQMFKTYLTYTQTLILRTVQKLHKQKPQSEIVRLDHLKVFNRV